MAKQKYTFIIKKPAIRVGTCEQCKASYFAERGIRAKQRFCSRACGAEFRRCDRASGSCHCCQKPISWYPSQVAAKYCSRSCATLHRRQKAATTCDVCGVAYTAIQWLRGKNGLRPSAVADLHKCCSKACGNELTARKLRLIVGPMRAGWKGGTTAEHKHGFRGREWPTIAKRIRSRDDNVCQDCGMTNDDHITWCGKSLEVHHKIPFHNFTSHLKANVSANLVTLCVTCHRKADAAVEGVQLSLMLTDHKRGRRVGQVRGDRCGSSALTDNIVRRARIMNSEGRSVRSIAAEFGVNHGTLYYAVRGGGWKHLPYPVKPS